MIRFQHTGILKALRTMPHVLNSYQWKYLQTLILYFIIKECFLFSGQTKTMVQLFVRAQELHTLEVSGTETVGDIKGRVAELEGLALADISMYCGGRPLENDFVLSACASDLSTLEVEVRMVGGEMILLSVYLYIDAQSDSILPLSHRHSNFYFSCITLKFTSDTS